MFSLGLILSLQQGKIFEYFDTFAPFQPSLQPHVISFILLGGPSPGFSILVRIRLS